MALNLKARLGRIRRTEVLTTEVRNAETGGSTGASGKAEQKPAGLKSAGLQPAASWLGWTETGFKTLKRELLVDLPFPVPAFFPASLAVLVPDFSRIGRIPVPGELLFFDLETTGLSGGAGTIAFLAAFGRFTGSNQIIITQYLLLDYPGESDFIERVVKEFAPLAAVSTLSRPSPPAIVSYNGKSFDSQILKTRCLMNGIRVPDYFHADLLHPARRLWRRVLPDCSQATIETLLPGLDRTGDISGAQVPEIWFSFLKTGENRELLSVCDHNKRDIMGLASIFFALAKIAADPLESLESFRIDEESLALAYREGLKRNPSFFGDEESYESYAKTGELLLESAAENGCSRAVFALGLDFFKKGRSAEGRALLKKITGNDTAADVPARLRAAALKTLAIDAEWRLGDLSLAIEYTDSALNVRELSVCFRYGLEKRRARLEEKIVLH